MQGLETKIPDDTSSVDADFVPYVSPTANDISDGTKPDILYGAPEYIIPEGTSEESPGDAIDAEIISESMITPNSPTMGKLIEEESITKGFGRRRRKNTGDPKSSPPNTDEWMDFFSRIVIRFVTEWYVDAVFSGLDEDLVSEADAEKLILTEEERDTIARPFAEYANKNPFMKKHGRQIVAISDSFESIVILGRWFSRVNRVARKYKPKKVVHGKADHGNERSSTPGPNGTSYGPVPERFPIINPGGS